MRTTVTVPDKLYEELMRFSHAKTMTDAVNQVIKDWIRLVKIQEIKKLRGNLMIDDNLKDLRAAELGEIELSEIKDQKWKKY